MNQLKQTTITPEALSEALDKAIADERKAKDAKRTKRTGLKYEYWQPRPDHISANGDCVMRAWTWALNKDYEEVLNEMQAICDDYTLNSRRRNQRVKDSGTPLAVIQRFAKRHGWAWKETKGPWETKEKYYGSYKSTIRKQKNVLFKADALPRKLCVAITTRHAVAVEDHVCLDSYDSRGDRSCVLEGYFVKED